MREWTGSTASCSCVRRLVPTIPPSTPPQWGKGSRHTTEKVQALLPTILASFATNVAISRHHTVKDRMIWKECSPSLTPGT